MISGTVACSSSGADLGLVMSAIGRLISERMGAKSSRSKKLDADPPPVQMVLSYRLAATFGGDPVWASQGAVREVRQAAWP
jgi:hypothetical protein